jgi:coenzyme F420 hydrogenase subunit beta
LSRKKNHLIDVINDGLRPFLEGGKCGACIECIKVCPGYVTTHNSFKNISGLIPELLKGWGPILEIWEGYATNSEMRYHGSSGGLTNAIVLYCLEEEGMHGVLHIGADNEIPWKNKTVFSQNRSELLKRTGSRYSPSSPCDGLDQIIKAKGFCAFIGKPCDIAGLRKAQLLKPDLDKNIGIAIGIFCAGTPSTTGTLDLLKKMDVNPEKIEELRYRGKGWPGMFTVQLKEEKTLSHRMSYMDAWGFLQKYRPFRCYLCPDGTSEFADISCGDPWYRKISEGEQGYSLVLVRTERGRKILQGAIEAGHVFLDQADPKILEASQKNLLSKRCAIWGRFLVMKAFGIPTPQYKGFSLFKNWLTLPSLEKIKSILGTMRRVLYRKYYRPESILDKLIQTQ